MSERRKVAILGGGVGAMVAAFELTQEDGWAEKYDITVYQLGWRLGGKGASGRNLEQGMRIQEHGLHIWGGYYNNAFRVMRDCYTALDRPPNIPIRNVEQAFRPVDIVYVSDFADDHPQIWSVPFPPNDRKPGAGGQSTAPRDLLIKAIEALKEVVERYPVGMAKPSSGLAAMLTPELSPLLSTVGSELRTSELHAAALAARALAQNSSDAPLQRAIYLLLDHYQSFVSARRAEGGLTPPLGSILAMIEIGLACCKGMLADGVLKWGFDPLDDMEWSAWVMKHGASREAMETAPGRCAYCYVFGSLDGIPDFEHRAVGAGTGMRALLRLIFTYDGSLFYKLYAGMGDIVFAPIYELLKQRGVRFEFFHKVTGLHLDPDAARIGRIEMEVQATLKDKSAGADYRPLVPDGGGLPSWPSTPLYDQLEQGEEIEAKNIHLESMWANWNGTPKTLHHGEDFDLVVLGISIGGLPQITGDLAERLPTWRAMLDNVKTVATQAMQLWFNDTLGSLGWPAPGGVLTGYFEPMDTWSNMSFLLPRESWPKDGPQQISYFCSVFEPTEPAPPYGPNDYPARQLAAVKAGALPWIEKRLPQLLTNTDGPFGSFNYATLYDPADVRGPARLDSQYWRVNVDPPSELYVQSVPGSTRYRLASDGSGVDNLFLAGDWVLTGLNAGCVEAATMAGLQAARAISGRNIEIPGEHDVMDSPLSAQNGPWPWSLVYAQGQISAGVVTLALPADEVASLLAPGLSLRAQSMTQAGLHPVGLIFSEQANVRPNIQPAGGMVYRECVIAIPFVGPSEHPDLVLMTMPELYLDKLLPTLSGWLMYGYRKHLAKVAGDALTMDVHRDADGAFLLKANLSRDGREDHPYAYELLRNAREIMQQPVVTPHWSGKGWLYSFLDYEFDIARITPLGGSVEIGAGMLGNPERRTMPVESVRQAALGGFLLDTKWTLTNPFGGEDLLQLIEQRAAGSRRSR